MKPLLLTISILAVGLTQIQTAWAAGTEHLGNQPLPESNYQNWPNIVPLVNHGARIYQRWVNGNERLCYSGDTKALNDALKKFAQVKADRWEVVLHPGPAKIQTFRGKSISFDWDLHLVGGIAEHLTTLDQGYWVWSPAPILTVYLGGNIQLDDLRIPAKISILELSDLKTRYRRALSSRDSTVRGWTANRLAALDAYDPTSVADITKLLDDQDQWVRLNAAHALTRFGGHARPALPALERLLKTDDNQLKQAVQKSIQQIQAADKSATAEKRHQKQLAKIHQFRKSLDE